MSGDIKLPGKRTSLQYNAVAYIIGPTFFHATGGWHVSGRENIPTSGRALICPNHISYLDPPAIGIAAKRRCCYMARKTLFDVPILAPVIRGFYAYPVDRDEGGRQAIRLATSLLEAGELVVMFPEGTRSPDGELIAAQAGAAYVAARAKAPIIPAAVWGTHLVMPRGGGHHRFPVYVRFGKPFDLPVPPEGERLSKEQLQELTDGLMARIRVLQDEIKAMIPEKTLQRAARIIAQRKEKASQTEEEQAAEEE